MRQRLYSHPLFVEWCLLIEYNIRKRSDHKICDHVVSGKPPKKFHLAKKVFEQEPEADHDGELTTRMPRHILLVVFTVVAVVCDRSRSITRATKERQLPFLSTVAPDQSSPQVPDNPAHNHHETSLPQLDGGYWRYLKNSGCENCKFSRRMVFHLSDRRVLRGRQLAALWFNVACCR